VRRAPTFPQQHFSAGEACSRTKGRAAQTGNLRSLGKTNCQVYLGLLARIELAQLSHVAAEAVVFSPELVIVVSIQSGKVIFAVGLGNVGTNLERPIVLELNRCMRDGMRVLV
jgi:hypothetical protein